MIVIYHTASINYAIAVERDLIEHCRLKEYDCWNDRAGGEGLVAGKSRYYVYVLLG